jgi:hypothetical protein
MDFSKDQETGRSSSSTLATLISVLKVLNWNEAATVNFLSPAPVPSSALLNAFRHALDLGNRDLLQTYFNMLSLENPKVHTVSSRPSLFLHEHLFYQPTQTTQPT